jgi:coproporphyrinogen III oxidase-like Fe-S oxidoreductase
LEKYVDSLNGREFPIEGTETLSMEQLGLESLYFGLRTKNGVDLEEISNHVGENVIDQLLREKLVTIREGFLCPTPSGLAIADGLTKLFSSPLQP